MVYYSDSPLDRTFAALADPTRRAMLARMGRTETISVSDLAKPFAISLPAVLKHIDVLEHAGLVKRNKQGRTVSCRLRAAPMQQAMEWLNRYQKFWSGSLDRLAKFLEDETWTPPPSRALRSSAGSAHRRKRSSPRGSTRKS